MKKWFNLLLSGMLCCTASASEYSQEFYKEFYESRNASLHNIKQTCIDVHVKTSGFEIPLDSYALSSRLERELEEDYSKYKDLPKLYTETIGCPKYIDRQKEHELISQFRKWKDIGVIEYKLTMTPDAYYIELCKLQTVLSEQRCESKYYYLGAVPKSSNVEQVVGEFLRVIKDNLKEQIKIYFK